jgi:D-sedoheptulose 7-phosphate isomerase
MLEQRIQQQFFESADLQYECAETLARQVAEAAQALLNSITGGGKLLLAGVGTSAWLARHLHRLLVGRFERDRPPLAAVALASDSAAELLALAQPGDALLLFDDPALAGRPGDAPDAPPPAGSDLALDCVEAAHQRDACAVVIARARSRRWPDTLLETDVLVGLPHDRPSRVLEAQLLVLHALADAIDTQLLGEQEPR